MKTIGEQIHKQKFPNEEYDPNDFNDWAKENEREAYLLCLQIAEELQAKLEAFKDNRYKDIQAVENDNKRGFK